MALIMVALRKAACILYFRRLMYFCTVTNQNQTKTIKMLQQQIRHPLEARWSVCIYRHCRSESSSLQANLHSDAVAAKSTHTRSVCLSVSLSLSHTHTHTHTHSLSLSHAHTHTHTHTNTHTHSRTHTHTRTHAHTHTRKHTLVTHLESYATKAQ